MTKRSILHIVTQTELGGAQRAVLALTEGCADLFAPHVAVGRDGDGRFTELCRQAGIPVTVLPNLRRAISPKKEWLAIIEIRSCVQAVTPTIVHSHSSKAGVLTSLALRHSPRPPWLVHTAHGWAFLEPLGGLRRLAYRLAERVADNRRDATIVLSEFERRAARDARLNQTRLQVIPNGVAPIPHNRTQARAALQALGIPATACIIGTVANFYPTKNIPALVRAFNQLAPTEINLHLVLIGDGEERPAIEALARSSRDRIHLLGARDDARQLMDGFDLFVLPSVKEGLPFVLLDAMEAGLPVLATTVGGIPQVIADSMNGLLCEPGDIHKGLTRAMARESQRPALGKAAQETIHALFLQKRMVADTLALYQKISSPQESANG